MSQNDGSRSGRPSRDVSRLSTGLARPRLYSIGYGRLITIAFL